MRTGIKQTFDYVRVEKSSRNSKNLQRSKLLAKCSEFKRLLRITRDKLNIITLRAKKPKNVAENILL